MKSEAKKLPTFGKEFSIYNIMNKLFVVFPYLRLVLNASRLIDIFCYLLFNTFRLALRQAQWAATFLLFSSKSPIISFFSLVILGVVFYFLHQHPSFHFLISFFWSSNVSSGYFCLCSSLMATSMLSSSTLFSSHS